MWMWRRNRREIRELQRELESLRHSGATPRGAEGLAELRREIEKQGEAQRAEMANQTGRLDGLGNEIRSAAIGGTIVALLTAALLGWQIYQQRKLLELQTTQIGQQAIQIRNQARQINSQEADTKVVRRTQLLTLVYETVDCDLTERMAGWEKRIAEARKQGERYYELEPRCEPKSPLRLRQEAVLALAKIDGESLNLQGSDLAHASLEGVDLRDVTLQGSDLTRADLSNANLSRTDLSRTDLSRTDLYRTDLSDANLSDANLSRAFLLETDLSDANLSDANLSGAYLTPATLKGADLSGANLSAATVQTKLRYVNLQGAIFNDVDFSIVDLSGAYLYSANLSASRNLNQHRLDQSIGDYRTELPEGLSPPEHWLREDEGAFEWFRGRLMEWAEAQEWFDGSLSYFTEHSSFRRDPP